MHVLTTSITHNFAGNHATSPTTTQGGDAYGVMI